jgi:hypothetical protein
MHSGHLLQLFSFENFQRATVVPSTHYLSMTYINYPGIAIAPVYDALEKGGGSPPFLARGIAV